MRRIEPNTEPYGDIISLDIQWATKPIEKYNPLLKMYVWDHDEVDREHYIEFIGGKHYVLDKGSCRICTRKVTHYPTKYYQKHYESGSRYSFLFDAEHYYCEECAKEQASKDYFNDVVPFEVNRFETRRDGETLEIKVYADGSRIEEVTSREAVKWQ